jgi:hypothetical protein
VARSAGGVRISVTGAAADPHGTRAAALQARVSAWGGSYRTAGGGKIEQAGIVEVFLPSAPDEAAEEEDVPEVQAADVEAHR